MSTYDDYLAAQREKSAERLARFEAVLSAGENAALWRVLPAPTHSDTQSQFWQRAHREVETGAGRFSLSCGDANVDAGIATLSTGRNGTGIRVHVSDLRMMGDEVAPTASASLKREPLVIARDLHRRVLVPGADLARRLSLLLNERIAQRDALLRHVGALREQGVTFRDLSDSETYEAKGWHTDLGSVCVTAAGKVYVERVTILASDLPALASLVKGAA